jgi:hypothetical protein
VMNPYNNICIYYTTPYTLGLHGVWIVLIVHGFIFCYVFNGCWAMDFRITQSTLNWGSHHFIVV